MFIFAKKIMAINIQPVTITAPKPKLSSRQDYANLKQFSDLYAGGGYKIFRYSL